MHTGDDVLTPYRLRTVRLGIQATWLALGALALLAFLPRSPGFDRVPYLAIVGAAAAGAAVIRLLPWERFFERGIGMGVMYAWSALDIVLITLLLAVVGPDSLDMFVLYGLTTLFFAGAYPPRAQVAMLAFTYASYLTLLALTGWPIQAGNLVARLGVLAIMTYLASFMSRELMGQIRAHHDARRDSERRASLLGAVAGAARGISSLDSDRVLASVVDATAVLGFDSAEICFLDEELQTYRVGHPRGLPREYAEQVQRADEGVVGMVLRDRHTVMIDDYSESPQAVTELRDAGYRAVIATPVWSESQLTAVLVAGTRDERSIEREEAEAFEVLAAQASRALENAERFEDERRTVERLAELDRLKQNFLATVSHEIRTPLTIIEGTGLTLEQRWLQLDDPTRREFLRHINANARTLENIISTLLDFSRLEAGRFDIQPRSIRVSELVDQVRMRMQEALAGHRLLVEIESDDLEVQGDPLLIDRVIENLVSNAVKYTPAETTILISVSAHDGEVELAVADEGPGIPPEELPRITERFFRGGDPNTRQTKGIGLGLALSRELLELHGAALNVSSEVGSGSRFSFRLPRADDESRASVRQRFRVRTERASHTSR